MNGHSMISKQQNLKWKPEDDTEVEATDAEAAETKTTEAEDTEAEATDATCAQWFFLNAKLH